MRAIRVAHFAEVDGQELSGLSLSRDGRVVAFVRGYEEPTLLRRYGPEYERYLAEVPGWWPRRISAGPAPPGPR